MPRDDRPPGLDDVERQLRPPSCEIRMTGLIEQAATGPRCMYTTATRAGSVGCVATTGSQARSATDLGVGLTARSPRTRGCSIVVSGGEGDADPGGAEGVAATADGAAARLGEGVVVAGDGIADRWSVLGAALGVTVTGLHPTTNATSPTNAAARRSACVIPP
jgi:hypothetical protein